jgi:glycosyltransferase involved in cell wall biosynthesis
VRILHVAATYLPATRYGGTIVSVHGLCRALAARGHDVHVFTTSVDGALDSPVPLATPVDRDGVKVWYFPSPRLRRLYWSPAMADALAAQTSGFDTLHLHALFVWPAWASARAARRAGVPYVVSPRGMLERALVRRKSRALKSLLFAVVIRRMLEHAAAIHVTSAREAAEAAAFGFALPPIHEVPNGVDLHAASAAAPSSSIAAVINGPPFVLFIGRISWKKGLDRLLAALARLPRLRLVIAGTDDDGYARTLLAQATPEVVDRTVFVGPVSGSDKSALLEHARALVLPSYSENFGNVVLESMAAGCPVVVTPEVGAARIVQDSGAGVVVNGDPVTLAAAVDQLLRDDPGRRLMSGRGVIAAAAYSWAGVAGAMEAVYERVLATHSTNA